MADNHVYGFSKPDAIQILQRLGTNGVGEMPVSSNIAQGGYIAMTPSGGIAARSGTTVTVADCDVYYLAGSGSTRTLVSSGVKLAVANMSTTAITGSVYILCGLFGGELVAPWEDC